mgnify:CR=1 FL=1
MQLKNMQKNLKNISKIKSKLAAYLKNKDVLDVILFGSVVKGKSNPNDIDIALITEKTDIETINGFHISIIRPKEFFIKPPSLINTLLREGHSLKNNKPLAELLRFRSKVLFYYSLSSLTPSIKVKIVRLLKGSGKNKGMVKEYGGEWIANQVFNVPTNAEYIFEKFLIEFNIKFTKSHILIH